MSRMMRLSARGPDSIENSARIRHSPRFEASRRNPVQYSGVYCTATVAPGAGWEPGSKTTAADAAT